MIFCEMVDDHILRNRTTEKVDFIKTYELELDSDKYTEPGKVIKAMYYSFTTLSTVGFGDISPQTDYEMLVCALIMFFGVALFSLLIGMFQDIIDTFKQIDADIGDGDMLDTFFDFLGQRNGGQPFDL